ncbi:MAG: hypothetical protein ABEK50_15400 [bacterium]
MSSEEDSDRHYSTGEIALSMIIVTVVMLLPLIAGGIYYIGWL